MPRVDPVLLLENKSADSSPTFELLSTRELAELLHISATGVRRLQQGRHIPFFKVGGSVRYAKHDVMAYLSKRRVESIE